MPEPRTHRGVRVTTVAVLALVGGAVAPATGQEADTDPPPAFELLDETMDVIEDEWDGDVPSPMVLWPEGRRAYQFARAAPTPVPLLPGVKGPDTVVPIDLDSLETLTTVVDGDTRRVESPQLDPPVYGPTVRHLLQPEQIAIDSERGVMFLPHGGPDYPCRGSGTETDGCLGGIHVIDLAEDALTPRPMAGHDGRIPFEPRGVDGVVISPYLRAMSHSDIGGEAGKLHLLVQEQAHYAGTADGGTSARDLRVPHYVFQIDVATGAHDWVVPAPGCTSYRQGHGAADNQNEATRRSHTIFAADTGDGTAVYVGCYGPSSVGSVGKIVLDAQGRPTGETAAFPGPAKVVGIQADPTSQRVWLFSLAARDQAWWVFDGRVENYLGVVTVRGHRRGIVDPTTGRLYDLGDDLEVSDGRRVPVAQTRARDLPMDDIMRRTRRLDDGSVDYMRGDDGSPADSFHLFIENPLLVDPGDGNRPTRLFVRPGGQDDSERWYAIADRSPVADRVVPVDAILEGGIEDPPTTVEVELAEPLTRTTFTGAARGYGLRTILLGGTDAAIFPNGRAADRFYQAVVTPPGGEGLSPADFSCGRTSREFTFGLSGSSTPAGQPDAQLQPGSSTGAASPMVVDDRTRRDLQDPVQTCATGPLLAMLESQGIDRGTAEDLLRTLGVRPPGDVPGAEPGGAPVEQDVTDREVTCTAPRFGDDGQVHASDDDATGDDQRVGPTFAAEVSCLDDDATRGSSRARLLSAGPVSVGEAYSEYDIDRDPATGRLVATAHSYARDVSVVHEHLGQDGEVEGTSRVHIDLVETRAEAWATGRGDAAGSSAECEGADDVIGAGTCIQTSITGATVVDGRTGETMFECDQCQEDDVQQGLVAAMRAALGDSWRVELREPDGLLANGADNGTLAGVQKREIDEFADEIMKGDLIKTLPALELVRYNDNSEGRGRQVYQFAGVELSTTFTRQCLGIVEGEMCVAPPVPLAQVEVSLTDELDGSPLAGGRFELAQTSAVSGATPLDSPVSCTTNATGRCELVALPAGSYTLTQTDAPGDYAPAEPLSLDLSPGSVFDVSVTNVREVGSLVAGLTNLDGLPLAGGMFELHADIDGDGTVGLDDPQVEVCTTGADGTCTMADLPLGAYVLSQAAAPDGYAAVDDQVPFVLDAPGQTATIGYTNAPAGSGASGSGSLGAVTELPPTQPVAVERPPGAEGPQVADPQASRMPLPQQLAETWQLLRRNPVQAAAFVLLLALAAAAVAGPMRRRRLLLTAS